MHSLKGSYLKNDGTFCAQNRGLPTIVLKPHAGGRTLAWFLHITYEGELPMTLEKVLKYIIVSMLVTNFHLNHPRR